MQIQFLNAPEFTIDSEGRLQRSGKWLVSTDSAGENISDLAMQWAGNAGDYWKEPNIEGSAFTLNKSFVVTGIKCRALDSRNCQITFTATPVNGNVDTGSDSSNSNDVSNSGSSSDSSSDSSSSAITPVTMVAGSYRFERKKDLSEYHSAEFIADKSFFPSSLPTAGSLIDWAGSNCRCESLTAKHQEDNNFIFAVTAVDISIHQEGCISSESSAAQIPQKSGKWLLTDDKLEQFLTTNALYQPAVWAGENYYISSVKTEPADSACRTRVVLTARQSSLKMLENLRSEEVTAICSGEMHKRYIWQSRWQAAAEDQALFEAMLGNSAESWTGDADTIVYKVQPRKISDLEFEYQLEACYPQEIKTVKTSIIIDNLPERKEYYTRVAEMRFSPQQCGYNWRSSGTYAALNNWQYQQLCPLDVTQALPQNWINQPIKVLEIVEVSFLAGTSAENIKEICSWFNSTRVEHCTIANISGCFLRYDLDVDDMTDEFGNAWTKICRVYRQSPAGYSWNDLYWV